MARLSLFGRLTNIQMILHTFLHGQKVGTDDAGNVYYKGKPRRGRSRERRWVMYAGAPEASAVPPEWHGWLHHQTNTVPSGDSAYRKDWQKPHQPNMTGTKDAYVPPPLKGQPRAETTGDYTPWKPQDS
ncbi:MAG: NADH:ubiquinone oxidoreductase subunit NDUFA12 [Alphaproteobacteria bacterium]|nr:NADH:ubiquinone oxidoreductase subunit NDUFA12 [Alphaproteobacteria bacterium]